MLADVGQQFGQYLIPGLLIMLFLAMVLTVKVLASRYQKIPPNKVAIIYGRGTKAAAGQLAGCKVVSGGGVLVLPIVQTMQLMDTDAFTLTIKESGIPNADNVRISVNGAAVCKISTTPEDLQAAAMSFLGQEQEQIQGTIHTVLIGHLRAIIGKMDINGLLRDRDKFNSTVVAESTQELKRLGIQLISMVIQEINDAEGYIDALGKKAVAGAKRDAQIEIAKAEAEATKQVSTAKREAAVVQASNEVAIADAERDRDIQRAEFKAAADAKKAVADNALAIANAAQQEVLKVAEASRDAAQARAQVAVQEEEAKRTQAELVATTIRPAEAAKEAAIIKADGEKQAAILQAQAGKEVAIQQAEGQAEAAKKLGEGQAAQTLATLNAQAEGEAAKTRQSLLAQAEGEAAKKGKVLVAEAEGTLKLAEALAKMTDSAKLILVLDRLAPLMTAGGDAGAKIVQAAFGPIAAGLGQIDRINITDLGGTGRGVSQIGGLVPQVVFDFISKLSALGIDAKGILGKLGLNAEDLLEKIGVTTGQSTTVAAGAESAKE